MSFNWKDYKTIAEHLRNNPDSEIPEAFYRSAISRAYYAAFHITKQKMVEKYGYTNPKWNAHKELLDFLGDRKDNNSHFKEAWRFLKDLRSQRRSADYDEVYDYPGQDVERASAIAFENCEKIIGAISELKKSRRRRSSAT